MITVLFRMMECADAVYISGHHVTGWVRVDDKSILAWHGMQSWRFENQPIDLNDRGEARAKECKHGQTVRLAFQMMRAPVESDLEV